MFDSCSLFETIECDIHGTVLSVGVAQHHRQALVAREFLDRFDVSPDRGQAAYGSVPHYVRHNYGGVHACRPHATPERRAHTLHVTTL